MPLTDAERKRLSRLREAGYAGSECPPGTSKDECQAWAEGVWRRLGEQMPDKQTPVVPFPFNGSQA
jgi:hypothetical protein